MTTVAARAFKEQYPDWKLTMAVGPQFADMLPLFYQHSYYDNYHVWETYEGWPSAPDVEYLRREKYDVAFHAFPPHPDEWWRHRHQYAEAAHMVGLHIPKDIQPVLTKWFHVARSVGTVAFAPFAGWYNQSNDKKLSIDHAQDIVNMLLKRGKKVLQIGGADEPKLAGVDQYKTSYFQSVKDVLGCDLLIHTDTGIGHVIGAYQHPAIGLYGYRYYGKEKVRNIQPISENTVCISEETVGQISVDSVAQALDNMGV